jgi:biotin-(acetyl-CoA carboxylase) ligase
MRAHTCEMSEPVLPPPFAALWQEGAEDVVERAVALAPARGAGTLVWRLAAGRLELAVVIEPDRSLAEARAAFLVAMAAALEALAAHGPPERQLQVRWPGEIVFDRARIGRGRLVWPRGCSESAEPACLVFGLDLVADRDGMADPGLEPDVTSLREEGFAHPVAILESFARHLMLRFDIWANTGLEQAARPCLERLEGARAARVAYGGVLVAGGDGAEVWRPLAEALR